MHILAYSKWMFKMVESWTNEWVTEWGSAWTRRDMRRSARPRSSRVHDETCHLVSQTDAADGVHD